MPDRKIRSLFRHYGRHAEPIKAAAGLTQVVTARARQSHSFDDLVSAREDRWGDGEAERLGGVEIDDQLECRRLLDRQIGRLGALEDLPGVDAGLARDGSEAWSVADQAAGRSELAPLVDRRNGMA